jgi:hypothetical protein
MIETKWVTQITYRRRSYLGPVRWIEMTEDLADPLQRVVGALHLRDTVLAGFPPCNDVSMVVRPPRPGRGHVAGAAWSAAGGSRVG